MTTPEFITAFFIPKSDYDTDDSESVFPIGIIIVKGSLPESITILDDNDQPTGYSICGTTALPSLYDISSWSKSTCNGKECLINNIFNITVYGSDVHSDFEYGTKQISHDNISFYISWHFNPSQYVMLNESDPDVETDLPVFRVHEKYLRSIKTKNGFYKFSKKSFGLNSIRWDTLSMQIILTNTNFSGKEKYYLNDKKNILYFGEKLCMPY